jgi:hypothetical protein
MPSAEMVCGAIDRLGGAGRKQPVGLAQPRPIQRIADRPGIGKARLRHAPPTESRIAAAPAASNR